MFIDEHCLSIIARYKRGEIAEEEARRLIQKHGDNLVAEVFANGFIGNNYVPV